MPIPESTPSPTTPPVPAYVPPPVDGIDLAPGVKVSESALRFQYARSRGPGGQNVNKVNTKAEVWVALSAIWGLTPRALARLREMAGKRVTSLGEIHISADSERSQEQNRAEVMERLKTLVKAAVHEPKARRKKKVSRAAKQRRLETKRRRGEVKSGRRGGGREE